MWIPRELACDTKRTHIKGDHAVLYRNSWGKIIISTAYLSEGIIETNEYDVLLDIKPDC